jgi:hypothetical protein
MPRRRRTSSPRRRLRGGSIPAATVAQWPSVTRAVTTGPYGKVEPPCVSLPLGALFDASLSVALSERSMRIEAVAVPSHGFVAAYGARAALALSAALRSGDGGALVLSMDVYRTPSDVGGALADVYISAFYSYGSKYPAEAAAYSAAYGVPTSVFRGLGARTLFAVLRFLRDAELVDNDAVVSLTAAGAVAGSGDDSQVSLARYYARTYGFQGIDFDVTAPNADELCMQTAPAVEEQWGVCEGIGMVATLGTVLAHDA